MSVLELLIQRRASGYRAGVDQDGHKVGLAVEGGGIRGVVTAAMMLALRDLDLYDAFDGFYGTSAGAINVCYWLGGTSDRCMEIYCELLPRAPYLDFWRLARGGRPADIDLVIGQVDAAGALDYERVVVESRRIRFGLGLSNIDERAPSYHYEFESAEDLRGALRVGAWLPFLNGRPQTYRRGRYVDGALYVPTAVYVALDDRCTHVLRLISRPDTPAPARTGQVERLMARRLDSWSAGAGRAFLDLRAAYLADQAALGDSESMFRASVVHPLACRRGSHRVTNFTQDPAALLHGARVAYDHVMRRFGVGRPPPLNIRS